MKKQLGQPSFLNFRQTPCDTPWTTHYQICTPFSAHPNVDLSLLIDLLSLCADLQAVCACDWGGGVILKPRLIDLSKVSAPAQRPSRWLPRKRHNTPSSSIEHVQQMTTRKLGVQLANTETRREDYRFALTFRSLHTTRTRRQTELRALPLPCCLISAAFHLFLRQICRSLQIKTSLHKNAQQFAILGRHSWINFSSRRSL